LYKKQKNFKIKKKMLLNFTKGVAPVKKLNKKTKVGDNHSCWICDGFSEASFAWTNCIIK